VGLFYSILRNWNTLNLNFMASTFGESLFLYPGNITKYKRLWKPALKLNCSYIQYRLKKVNRMHLLSLITCNHSYNLFRAWFCPLWVDWFLRILKQIFIRHLVYPLFLPRFRLLALKFSLEGVHFQTKLQGRIFPLLDMSIFISLNTLNTIKNTCI